MKLICIISHPRSGSTSLMKKLEVSGVASVLEIFHLNEHVICQHIDEGLGKGSADKLKQLIGRDTIREYALQEPLAYLDKIKVLAQEIGKHTVIFKVFPGHLRDVEKLAEVISVSDAMIKLRRNTLQSYISNKKAIKVGTYANVDTSGIDVDFNAEEFQNWRRNIYSFFSKVDEICKSKGIEISDYNYEELYSDDSLFMSELCDTLKLQFQQLSQVSHKLKKQDNKSLASEKVSNNNELMYWLEKNDLQLLDSVNQKDINPQ